MEDGKKKAVAGAKAPALQGRKEEGGSMAGQGKKRNRFMIVWAGEEGSIFEGDGGAGRERYFHRKKAEDVARRLNERCFHLVHEVVGVRVNDN
jgi:hypothetical protein